MDIDALTGKQLGMEVAKRVMEWTEWTAEIGHEMRDYDGPFPVYLEAPYPPERDRILVCRGKEGNVKDIYTWAPWRDMNDCWEVVEEITKLPIGVTWTCNTQFGLWFDTYHLWACNKEEACEVILRAALKAVKGEGDGD